MTRITVLLATYNGRRWLPEQLASILDQQDVAVRVIALDDGSSDGTVEWLAERASDDSRITVLPSEAPSGSASTNFYRLIARADIANADLIAFADQDDIWMPGKLARHAGLIASGADGVSSSITSFDIDGHRRLVKKSYPQRGFDFLTESPGPGSTFLMKPELFGLVKSVLARDDLARTAEFHDSLVYAIARSHSLKWRIDPESTVDYRQHDSNVMGSNIGWASALARLALVRSHSHREQAILHARVGLGVASAEVRPGLERMLTLMTSGRLRDRFTLAMSASSMRRRPRDRWIIGLLIATGIW